MVGRYNLFCFNIHKGTLQNSEMHCTLLTQPLQKRIKTDEKYAIILGENPQFWQQNHDYGTWSNVRKKVFLVSFS